MRISDWSSDVCSSDLLMPMGRVTLRGRARPVDVFTLRPDLSAAQRARIADLVAAHAEERSAFVTCATAVREEFGDDPAILFLLERLNETDSGESYAIGRAHVCTPVTNAHLVCRLLLETTHHPQLL